MHHFQTEKLYQDFPELFNKDTLTRGFECQDGWFDLLRECAASIREGCGDTSSISNLKITRIKQQMGKLIITAEGADEYVRAVINDTESKSRSICEFDGEPATGLYVCAPYWFRYLCKQCAEMHSCMTIDNYHNNQIESYSAAEFI